jgi:hypothetical protein
MSGNRDVLASDIGALAVMMARILDVDHVRLRLDVADEVMCPKFHIDRVPARLLCTYRGAGDGVCSAWALKRTPSASGG